MSTSLKMDHTQLRIDLLMHELATLRARLDKPITFCPECGCSDIVELHFAQRTEKGHSYCIRCKQELFKGVDYSEVIAANIESLRAALAEMTERARKLGEAVLEDHSKDCKHCSLATDNEANGNELRKRPTCCDCPACTRAREVVK